MLSTVVTHAIALVVGLAAGWWSNTLLGKKVTAAEAAVKQAADDIKKI